MNNLSLFHQAAVSILIGIALTILLTIVAFEGTSNAWVCTFAWNGCLGVKILGTPESAGEGTPLDVFGFAVGILLGIPLYSMIAFVTFDLCNWFAKRGKKSNLPTI